MDSLIIESAGRPNDPELTRQIELEKAATAVRSHPVHEHCEVCRNEIKVMSFKGTGVCSTNCDKKRKGEKVVEKALSP